MENRRPSSNATPGKFNEVKTTPNRSSKLHSFQLMPNSSANSSKFCTPHSIRQRNGTFSSFPIVNTPTPPSRFRKIINPFEAGLTERLHLPLIGSPSLFHRPATPQLCSTQLEFEWTIDEVSSLNPANVEAHETQFQSVIDPEIEAKAQAAISSFFKEQIIVPSPVDCPIRDPKIILNLNNSFTDCRPAPAKSKRDGYCQTELTLPPILPKEVEDALRPFFTFIQSQQQTPSKDCDRTEDAAGANDVSIDHDARDASLRRKLFQPFAGASDTSSTEYERDVLLDSPTPRTPELDLRNIRSQRFLTPQGQRDGEADYDQSPLNISLSPVKRESFGCISPISKVMAITPHNNTQPNAEKTIENESRTSASSLYRSTPERSTIFRSMSSSSINTSVDGGAQPKITRSVGCDLKRKSFHLSEEHTINFSGVRSSPESNATVDGSYEDDMHLSQNSYGSQQHPHTPTLNKSKRRRLSANPKNLSHSFNSYVNEENMSVIEHTGAMTLNATPATATAKKIDKTDSGFNETDDLVRQNQMQYEEARCVVGGGGGADADISMTDAF